MKAWPTTTVLLIAVVTGAAKMAACADSPVRPPAGLTANSAAVAGPKVVVRQEDYDFGKMETNNAGRHEFVLANAGDEPLTLKQGKGSCGCCTCICETQLPDRGRILPGESATVTLKWTIKRYTGKYYQSSTILTNDPSRPEVTLGVSGRIVPAVRVVPWNLAFSSPVVGQEATGEVRVYGYRSEPLRIIDCRWSDPSTSQWFETTIVPLPADEVARQQDARDGFLLRVTLKPGLPLGPFRQAIVLDTNVDSRSKLEIPIQGRIINHISVAGPGWDSRAGVLKLPPIAGSEGIRRSLFLVVRGPRCERTKLELRRIVPDYVRVELGETEAINDGASTRTPLVIRIPAGSPSGNYLGPPQGQSGQIVIDTDHPQQPRLRLLLSFVVKE
jgi:hypothetical protein